MNGTAHKCVKQDILMHFICLNSPDKSNVWNSQLRTANLLASGASYIWIFQVNVNLLNVPAGIDPVYTFQLYMRLSFFYIFYIQNPGTICPM